MYYAYYRVSTQTQAECNGTQMQKDVVEKYCKENNIELADSFADEGISGTVVDRIALTDLLATIQSGDRIIVQNTSRLWRDDFAKVMIRKAIQKAGADVISIEQKDYSVYISNPNEFLVNSMFELLDQYDRLSTVMKLSKGRKAKANKGGKACGNTPLGYKWDGREVVIDYNNNLIIQDIYNKYIEYDFSLAKLYKYCIEKEYKSNNGKELSKPALLKILSNDFYIGIVTHADKKVKGTHEPIVDECIWNMVQEKTKKESA